MKSNNFIIFEIIWFVIIEIVIAVAYAVSVYFKATNGMFKNNYWLFNLIISIIFILFSIIAIYQYIRKHTSKVHRVVAIIYVLVMSADTCINDSLVGVTFLVILLMNLVRNIEGGYKAVAQLFLASAICAEFMSLLSLMEVVHTDSVMSQSIGNIWIDLVFVVAVVLYMVTRDKDLNVVKPLKIILPIIVISLDVVCIGALSWGAYLRCNKYCVTADQIKAGTSVFITSANASHKALTCDENKVIIDELVNSDNQVFTFDKSEENRYWHIVADNSFVLDIEYVLFEDDNTVIAWDENGVIGQHWQVEDIGNNVVEIKSFEPEYNLTWGRYVEDDGSVTQRTLITSNSSDINRYFFLKNAETIRTPIIGWIVNGNRFVAILAYIVIIVLVTVATCVTIIRR